MASTKTINTVADDNERGNFQRFSKKLANGSSNNENKKAKISGASSVSPIIAR